MDLKRILVELSKEEKIELANLLAKDLKTNNIELNKIKLAINKEQAILCPHCKSSDIYGHGIYKGRKCYMCKSCKRTFNDFTGTAISCIKKAEKFQQYMELVAEKVSIRKASKKIGVNVKTIFDWRHKLLSSLSSMNGQSFTGIVECDDKQIDFNNKGDRNLSRESFKRTSDRETKRGVSNDKISIMVATDRKGHPTMHIAKIGRVDVESIEKIIGNLISSENVLCSDSHPSIIAWAKDKHLEHHTFVASRQHIKDKCYHVQHVNSIDNLYERWIKRFYGVATKYLDQYLNWFVFLEKVKKSDNPIIDLARNVSSNMSAISNYRSIADNYENLLVPQLSKT
jgi:transposase-like protein